MTTASHTGAAPGTPSIAIVGGGWAGFAAAAELARRGLKPTLYEASRILGGRARAADLDGRLLDNGQHIMLGAYRDTLACMRMVGIDTAAALLNLPLQMRYPAPSGGMDFVAPRLPAPLHMLVALWRATGLSREDKMALARFSTAARWMGWELHHDCSVTELLRRFDQTARLTALMWRPLCIAALNTPPERASAKVFLAVLRDSLGAKRAASDMLLPRVNLSALFPDKAAAFVTNHGGTVRAGARVRAMRREEDGWSLQVEHDGHAAEMRHDAVIVATGAEHARPILPSRVTLPSFDYEPITTCYLQYDAQLRLAAPFYALVDAPERMAWGQFVFDRGWLDAAQSGLLAVVVSASTPAVGKGHDALAVAIAAQLAQQLGMPALAQPAWTRTVTEKRATFACAPSLQRPAADTGVPGLFLAGDYVESDYPATLEAAVRSGLKAAALAADVKPVRSAVTAD